MTAVTADDKERSLAEDLVYAARAGVCAYGMVASPESEHRDVAVAAVAWVAFTLAAQAAGVPKDIFMEADDGN